MPTRKKSSPRRAHAQARVSAHAPAGVSRSRRAGAGIRKTWAATLHALTAAEAEAERQVRLLLKERRKAARSLDERLAALQVRLRRERDNLGRRVNEAVRGTLVALDIPSRREVAELTRKVDDLSRKIDAHRRLA